jgi:hypothetical protein
VAGGGLYGTPRETNNSSYDFLQNPPNSSYDAGGLDGDIFPHSLPTYMDRAKIHRRWEETSSRSRGASAWDQRQNSANSGSGINGGLGAVLAEEDDANLDADELRDELMEAAYAAGREHAGSYRDSQLGFAGGNNSYVDRGSPMMASGGSLRDRSISHDSSDSYDGGRHNSGASMSTSLTVFDILESSRPGMGVVLDDEETEAARASAKITRDADSRATTDINSGFAPRQFPPMHTGLGEGERKLGGGMGTGLGGGDLLDDHTGLIAGAGLGSGDGGLEEFAFELDLDE